MQPFRLASSALVVKHRSPCVGHIKRSNDAGTEQIVYVEGSYAVIPSPFRVSSRNASVNEALAGTRGKSSPERITSPTALTPTAVYLVTR
jgi:hypothetical protein